MTSRLRCTWLGLFVVCGACIEPPDGGANGADSADRRDIEPASAEVHSALTACFGRAPFTICLPEEPTALVSIASPATTIINTDTSPLCAPIVSGGNVCVVAASVMTIKTALRATGSRPLVLLASRTIVTSALIDVGSHRGRSPEAGAAADPAVCATMPGQLPDPERGGAGGSFVGRGGAGGFGGEPGGTVAGTTLRGGCAGQAADSADGVGGHGGGAVLLVATSSLHIDGDINAAGEGGGAGVGGGAWSGGAGGGAGGMIVLDAPIIAVTGMLLANGGGGGEGSGAGDGHDGADPSGLAPASGGSGGSFAGDGGNGAAGIVAGSGGDGLNGSGRDGGGGTGGGGGGAGIILAPAHAALGTRVSPPATRN